MSGIFGVTKDTKVESAVPFRPTEEQPITLGYLKSVAVEDREIKRGDEAGSTKKVLVFRFESKDGGRVFSHTEWDIAHEDPDVVQWRAENLNMRVGHIYSQYADIPDEGIGSKANTFNEYISEVAKAYGGLKDMASTPIWIKVAYSLKRPQAGLGFPQKPNFVEKAVKGQATKLYINAQYESIEAPKPADPTAGLAEAGSADAGDFPSF